MMPRVCTVCTHADRDAIDKALAGPASNRAVASLYRVSEGAIRRHKAAHIPAAMVQAQEAAEAAHGDSLLAQVKELQSRALSILGKAEAAGQWSVALQGVREARGCLELLGKLMGELQDAAPTYNTLVVAPEWLATRAALLAALEPYPEARTAAAAALLKAGHDQS